MKVKILLATLVSAMIGGLAHAAISITVNNSSATVTGRPARQMIKELVSLGVPIQKTRYTAKFTGEAYNLEGEVWSTSATCSQMDQFEMRLQNLISTEQYKPIVTKRLSDVESNCESNSRRGAKRFHAMMANFMAKEFEADGGMSQTRYFFDISCDKGLSRNDEACLVQISNTPLNDGQPES